VPNYFSATSFGIGATFIALAVVLKVKKGATTQLPLGFNLPALLLSLNVQDTKKRKNIKNNEQQT
jgi:hypothetical protein